MRAANMQALTVAVQRRYPGVVVYGIGDAAHRLRVSDHNEDDTAGSRSAQTDADSRPEHRAIDIMLGAAFIRSQAHALIARLLADPAARARLFYIIFDGSIWSRSNGWARRDFDGDPHTDHIHISGIASDDENAAAWPAVEGDDMALTRDDAELLVDVLLGKLLGKSGPVVAVALQETHGNVRNLLTAVTSIAAVMPKLDAILAAALDDGDTTVVLGPEALAEVQAIRAGLAALPAAVVAAEAAALAD